MTSRPPSAKASPAPEPTAADGVLDISERQPDAATRRAALLVLAVSAAVFLALIPVARQPLAPAHWFIPLVQSALVVNDLITAVLLLGQLRLTGRSALLVLASGYVFAAVMAIIHLLSFPGVFAPGGVLGGGAQTTAYLHVFWHIGLPVAVIAYVGTRKRQRRTGAPVRKVVPIAFAAVGLLAVAFTLLATAGNDLLPPILEGNRYSSAFNVGRYGQWALTALAVFVLWRSRPRSVLDLWVAVMLCNSFFEIALVSIFNTGRYDLGFYAGRVYAMLSSCTVLVMLLAEHGKVHRELARARHIVREETALRVSSEAEARALESYRLLADMIPQHVWLTRGDGHHDYFSRSWYEFSGSKPGEPLGDGWLGWLHPDDRERTLRTWKRSLATGEPYSVEYRFRGADGHYHWFIGQAAALRNAEGAIVRWFGTLTDISENKRHEAEREKLLAAERDARAEAERRRTELERLTQSRLRLMRGLSHDLRSPLSAADMSAALLEFGPLTAQQGEAVRRIRRGIRGSVRLIDDLTDLARAEAGQIELKLAPLWVRQVAQEIADEFQAQAASVELELVVEVPADLQAQADPMRLRQILANLVSNAVKYAPRGTVRIRGSRAQAGIAGNRVGVSVVDSGPGIPAAHQGLVFEEYARLESGSQQGSGIGLAISRRIARLMGGDLTLDSAPGRGCDFTLWLPPAPTREPLASDAVAGSSRAVS